MIVAKLQAAYDCGGWDPWDAKRRQLEPARVGETLTAYVKRWCDDREARGNRSVRDDRSRLAHYLVPAHGHKLVTEISFASAWPSPMAWAAFSSRFVKTCPSGPSFASTNGNMCA